MGDPGPAVGGRDRVGPPCGAMPSGAVCSLIGEPRLLPAGARPLLEELRTQGAPDGTGSSSAESLGHASPPAVQLGGHGLGEEALGAEAQHEA